MKTGAIILGIILLGFGLWIIFTGYNLTATSIQSINWPKVSGTVISSNMTISTFVIESSYNTFYNEHILVTYAVAGITYNSGTYTFLPIGYQDINWTQQLLNEYPLGSNVSLYYNPDNPAQAVIVNGISWNGQVELVGGALCILFAFACFYWGIKHSNISTQNAVNK